MSLLELAEMVQDLINKHGPSTKVIFDYSSGENYCFIDGGYTVKTVVNEDLEETGEQVVVMPLANDNYFYTKD